MKKFILFLFIFGILFSVNAQKQTFKYSDSWGNSGFNLESQKSSGVEIVYSVKEFSISDNEIEGEIMQNINLSGIILFNDAGMPDLPGESKLIAVPEGAKPILKIIDYRTETVEGVEMAPAPVIPFDTEPNMVYEKDMKVFSQDAFYPADPIKISELLEIRGVDAVMLGITPFQYNPVTKQLIVYKDIKLEITFESGKGYFGENRLRNRVWESVLDDVLFNYSSLPKIDFDAKAKNAKDGEYEYVILTLDNTDFTDWAETIAEFRRKQGISTGVFTISDVPGGNTVSSIETWVDNMYNTWTTPPAAVLILADYGTDASGITSQSYSHPSPFSDTYITDNKYADVDEDDLPDIVLARITANDATQLEVMITKFIDNESNPPTNVDFYNHPITALGWQDDRWFQICSEVVGGFWNSLGKETVRINELGTPANNHTTGPWSTTTYGDTPEVLSLFGPDSLGYIPATPQELGGFTGGTATDVNNAINSGSFMLQHRDHGGETGWSEPDYDNSDIDGLTNTDLPFIWSVNCLTGKFNHSSECFAEKFHRYSNGGNNSGALGIIAATEVSYSFVNDTYVWGCYDNMWPNFMPAETANPESRFIYPAFANVAGKNFLYQSSWPYNTDNKQITYRLFHHHGDPYLNVYSEVPQNLSVTCPSTHIFGDLTIDITVDAGATIAVTYYNTTDEETVILGTALSSGGTTTVNLSSCPDIGTNLLVTITKQNYFRYTQDVLVISASGPYDIAESFIINDGGNNEAEFDETFNLDITLKNVGSETSENITVTLTTSDIYVESLTNAANVSIPDLVADASYTTSGQFTVELANNIPDQYNIQFNLEITDNYTKQTYNSIISFNVNAPVLTIGSLTIDDASGNGDGILDPGETADIIIQTTNNGHADITNVIGAIASSSSDLTINSAATSPTVLNIGQTGDFAFNVTADGATPEGTAVDIDYTVTAGVEDQYTAFETKEIIIGFVPDYCEASGGCDEYIENVLMGDIDNSSSCDGYYDYTDISTDVEPGQTYPITVTVGTPYSSDELAAYVDWNYDGDFEDSGEEFVLNWNNPTATADIVVPERITSRMVTMRIRLTFSNTPTPCGTTTYGEVEDYTLNVLPGITPGGTLTASNSDICIGSNTGDITLTYYSGTITDWEKRLDGGSWQAIGHTSDIYSETPSEAGTWEYRVEVNSGSDYSNIVSITVVENPVAGYTFIANNQELTFTNTSTEATSYSWDFGDGNNSTDENPVHIYSASDTYTVTLTASNGVCADDVYSEDIAVTFVGISQIESNVRIVPNPNNGLFTIDLGNLNASETIVSIYTVSGQIIYQLNANRNILELDLTNYDKGVYFVRITSGSEVYNSKIILK